MDYDKSMNTQENDRTILHCDMNGFYASVELLSRPDLVGLPMAVCGDPKNRHGVILAKSEEAKTYGIQTAMTVWQAMRLCPDLRLVAPHHDKYKYWSGVINEIYQRYTDMVEPFSIDESWLDVTASRRLFGDGKEIADQIRETVKKETGLTLSAGVSFNKIFAKMGSDYKKPDATTVITRENFKDLLWPLPAGEMFFVGSATAEKLAKFNILTIGDIASQDRAFLAAQFGKYGGMLYDYANGLDNAPVALSYEKQKIKSVGNGITFRRNLNGEQDVRTALTALSDHVATRLRAHGMKAFGVKVDIKDPSLKTISRQKQLPVPVNTAEEIFRAAFSIIKKTPFLNRPVRLLAVTGINLCDESYEEVQMDMFGTGSQDRGKQESLDRAMDEVRRKYGKTAISFARILGNDIGVDLSDIREEDGGDNNPNL